MEEKMSQKMLGRREFLRLSSLVAASAALAGCAPAATPIPPSASNATEVPPANPTQTLVSKATEVSKPSEIPAKKEPIKLEWWHSWGEGELFGKAVTQIAEAYMKLHPEVTIVLGYGKGGTSEAATTAIAAGIPPDLLETSTISALGVKGVYIDLTDRIAASKIDKSDRYGVSWDRMTWQGKVYGLPFEDDLTTGLVYNKALFEKAGLDPEVPPKNWDELRTFSDKITQKDDVGNLKVLGFRPLDAIGSFFTTWLLMGGAKEYFDFDKLTIPVDTPEMRKVVEYIIEFYKAYGPENMESFNSANGSWTGAPDSAFNREVQGMIINGLWSLAEMAKFAPDMKVGIAWVPTLDGKTKITQFGGHGNGVPTGVKNPDASFDLDKFIGGFPPDDFVASQILWDIGGTFPMSKAFVKTLDFSRFPGMQWYIDSVSQADVVVSLGENLPLVAAFSDGDWGPMVSEVAFGKIQLDDALKELQAKVDKAAAETFRK